jgi:hypothetical protein
VIIIHYLNLWTYYKGAGHINTNIIDKYQKPPSLSHM